MMVIDEQIGFEYFINEATSYKDILTIGCPSNFLLGEATNNVKVSYYRKQLKKLGVSLNNIDDAIDRNIGPIKKLNKNSKPEVISKTVTNVSSSIFKEISAESNESAAYILIVLLITTIVAQLALIVLLGPIGVLLHAVVVGPVIEEMGKNISIKHGHSGSFYILFNAVEFLTYVGSMTAMGIPLPIAVGVRIPALFIHFCLTKLQKNTMTKNKYNDEDMARGAALIQGSVLHGLFNFLVSM